MHVFPLSRSIALPALFLFHRASFGLVVFLFLLFFVGSFFPLVNYCCLPASAAAFFILSSFTLTICSFIRLACSLCAGAPYTARPATSSSSHFSSHSSCQARTPLFCFSRSSLFPAQSSSSLFDHSPLVHSTFFSIYLFVGIALLDDPSARPSIHTASSSCFLSPHVLNYFFSLGQSAVLPETDHAESV